MVLNIPDVLKTEQVAHARELLIKSEWVDGRVTAGSQSGSVKNNRQIPENSPVARELGEMILASLEKNPLFVSGALPLKVFPPLFNRYEGGEAFGTHVDNAIRQITGTPYRIRTDLSATLFLSNPADYDGGELCIEDSFGTNSIKLPAGHLVLYPASSLHHVRPVTRGVRLASFFWIQSMVKDAGLRRNLFDLDQAIQGIRRDHPEHKSALQLTNVYHNLLRHSADL